MLCYRNQYLKNKRAGCFSRRLLTVIMTATALLPFSATAGENCEAALRTMNVEGTSLVKAAPDMATVVVSVNYLESTAEKARDRVEQTVTAFLNGLKNHQKLKNEIDFGSQGAVKAAGLTVMPEYSYDNTRREHILKGYRANREVEIRLHNFGVISTVLDVAMSSGINTVYNISYEVEHPESVRDKARELAVADARKKAAQIAKGLDIKLVRVKSVEYQSNEGGAVRYNNLRMMKTMGVNSVDSADGGVYSPDSMEFADRVNVVYIIE